MPRFMLSDELWPKLRAILLQHGVYHKPDLRMTVEGMLYRMRVGCPWRDLPCAFGKWNSIYRRFNVWSAAGTWLKVFNALLREPDFEWAFIDGTYYVKAHQYSTGAATRQPEAIGKSRAGLTSKIHLAVDGYGLPVAFEITGGEINDCTAASELTAQPPLAEVIVGARAMTVPASVRRAKCKVLVWSSPEDVTHSKKMLTSTEVCTVTGISSRTPLFD